MGRLTWVLLGLFLFAVANSDVLASSSDNVGPSESQCRPYIEKAIHNLKTGDKDEDMQSDQPADSVEDKKKDIDLDGDGIPNEQDSDIDGDATLNEDDEDIDGDGILNIDDEDIDGDVIPNERDSDMDGDGVPNVHDHDIDGDGVPNVADTDLDGDGVPNDRDHDVDGDGVKNADDNDLDGDGIPNDEDDDMDGDGIPNDQDDDMDGDGIPNTQDDDMDGDGIPNSEDNDLDGDGIPNNQDDDIDGDGLPNGQDNDMDGDGVSNERDNDIDGDGVLNIHDQDIDGDGIPNDKDDDIDGDSIPNTEDNDIDGDGVSNVGDHDIDGDGISNHEDTDIDGDGVPNDKDHDVDGDGMPNEEEPASLDIDGDGIPNDDDVDIDGDSKLNEVDEDMDGDGILNIHDRDVDGDGVPNVHDEDSQEMLAQTSAPKESAPIEAIDEGSSTGGNGDIDGDGIPDEHDDDIDGDGVPNHKDEDIDGDGVPNNKDSDVDGDGIPNEHDEDNGDKVVDEEIVEVSAPSEQKVEETVVEPAEVIPEVVPTPVVETEVPESKEPKVPESKEAEVPEPKEAEVPESKEAEVVEIKEAEIQPEDELLWEGEVPVNRRNREHITELLQLNDEFNAREKAVDNVAEIILKDIKRIYENAIKPLETQYKYRDLSNRHFGDPEIFSKPLILFMGPWSGGKSTILNYLTDNEYKTTSLRSGAEPSPAYFNILMWGNKTEVLDGTQLAADYTFSGLQKFGQGLEERLRGMKMPSKLLEKVNIVEIPGILEVRKQVSRVFPFNDACQWFIDRADIIFLVYDPAKLDVGPETEAILDQLKGREYQTRIILNKADTVKPEELLRVQSALIWNISPLMSSAQPPSVYTTSLWSNPYKEGAPARLLMAQERAFLRDLREAIEKRVEHKIGSARRFAVRVRNHAKMVDCYLNTYYNHKTLFSNKKSIADQIIENPQNYHIYEGLSTLTNISRYDLPDPEVYRDFFRLNPLYEFKKLSETCTYFRGCPITKLDIAIAYDLPELANKYKKMVEAALNQPEPKELAGAVDGQAEKTQKTKS